MDNKTKKLMTMHLKDDPERLWQEKKDEEDKQELSNTWRIYKIEQREID